MPQNPWLAYLEEEPQAAFGAFRPQTGPRGFQDYWRKQYSDVWQQFQDRLGQAAAMGKAPDILFTDYLRAFPWQAQWGAMTPREKGTTTSRFAPYLRFLWGR